MGRNLLFTFFGFVSLFYAASGSVAVAKSNLADLKKPGYFAIVRHTRAPGTGDPAGFKLDDCKTQRNLSADGVAQAKRLGKELKATLGSEFFVYTSEWCRCRDTAKNLGGRSPQTLTALNSFFQDPKTEASQTQELKKWLSENIGSKHPLILVTHQVNITALTGVFPSEGEVLVLNAADLKH